MVSQVLTHILSTPSLNQNMMREAEDYNKRRARSQALMVLLLGYALSINWNMEYKHTNPSGPYSNHQGLFKLAMGLLTISGGFSHRPYNIYAVGVL